MIFLSIVFFGLIGVFTRYLLGINLTRLFPTLFPIGTFSINAFGSFLIGIAYVASIEKGLIPEHLRVGLITGFLGGFTTFSAYTLESVLLLEQGRYWMGSFYLLLSPLSGLIATLSGCAVARMFFKS